MLDSLFIKRFGLPSNCDISSYKDNIKYNRCPCGNYYHIACIFLGRGENFKSGKKINILSYGMNQYTDVDGSTPSVHAEYNAIANLPPRPRNKRLYRCNIFVTRLTKTLKFGISKPCYQCVYNMYELPRLKGYRIKNVYYTDRDENIIKRSLVDMLNIDERYHTYYNK
jgi:tRNA(Arg) A34 adenosine deaminase TadA